MPKPPSGQNDQPPPSRRGARQTVVFRINRLASSFTRASTRFYLAEFGYGVPHVRTLHTLGDHGPLSPSRIAEITAMDKAMTSRVLANLLRRRLIEFEDPSAGPRSRAWRLSATGVQLVERLRVARDDRQAKLLSDFSEGDLKALNGLLDRLFLSSEKLRLDEAALLDHRKRGSRKRSS